MTTGDLPLEPHRSAHVVGHGRSARYEIRVHGHLAPRWAVLFDGMELSRTDDGTTVIRGPVADQAALHGLLARLRDLGVPLLSLTEVHADASVGPTGLHHPPAPPTSTPTTSPRSNDMITVHGLTKHYGGRTAVDDLTFTAAAGRVTGFVGPNGAGKSTTMRMMVGLTQPDAGEVRYDGTRYTELRHPVRTVGAVLDPRCMHPGRTARHHLRALAALSDISADRVEQVLVEVGLETAMDQRAGGFSLGMRQRLALAGALLGDPAVLLLDEPSNGLDPDGIRWLRNHLVAFAADGGTVFVSSHLMSELSMFADDLVVVGAGRLLAAETVEAITARSESTVVVATPQVDELIHLLAAQGLRVRADGERLVVSGTTTSAVSQLAFEHGIRLLELAEATRSLEDSLLDMTGESAEYTSA